MGLAYVPLSYSDSQIPPYDDQLKRLSENYLVLHYIHNMHGEDKMDL